MKKVYIYDHDMSNDFGTVGHDSRPIPENFRYINNSFIYRVSSWILYYLIAKPILFLITKIIYGIKINNKKSIKTVNGGYFLFLNHTHYFDAFIPHVFLGGRKRVYVLSNPDVANIPFVNKLVMKLGCLPIPKKNGLSFYRKFINAVGKRVNDNGVIAIYPEATLWPYYNDIRPFTNLSFKYPVMFNKPIIVGSKKFVKRKILKPKMVITLSDPIYPDANKTDKENMQMLYEKTYKFLKDNVDTSFSYCQYIEKKDE